MSEEKKKNWFEKNQERGNRARELSRRLKEGDSDKLKENLNELKALLDEFATSPKPTREDREEMLDSLKEKYGALPKNELFAKGLEELVKAHQSEKPEPNRLANDKLAMAIIYRNPAEVRRWLAEGADPNLAAAGSSLLKLALLGRNEEIIGAMIEAGAKINSLEAVLLGDIPKLKALLVEGAKVDETDGQGMTLLHWAAGYGKSETVQALLECGANFNALSLQGSSSLLTWQSQYQKSGY